MKLTKFFSPCSPHDLKLIGVEGAEHTGLDAFLRCEKCRSRTIAHVECERLSDDLRQILMREWRAGRRTATRLSRPPSLERTSR